MNKIIILCILLFGFNACMPIEPLDEPAPFAPPQKILTADDILQMQSPEQLNYRTYKDDKKQEIKYYDKWRRPEVRPMKNGFYRKIIGYTNDGRKVVQDFYQNNDTPYTSPYIAIKDAKLRLFGDNTAIDSRVAWYAPDGSLQKMSVYANGKEQGEIWLFHNNRLRAYLRDDTTLSGSLKMQFFHEKGHLIAQKMQKNDESDIFFYHDNGTAMLSVHDTKSQSTRLAWDENGKNVAPSDIHSQLLYVQNRIRDDLKKMNREKDLMNEIID